MAAVPVAVAAGGGGAALGAGAGAGLSSGFWMKAAPYIASGVGSLLSGVTSGKGARQSPIQSQLVRTQKMALGELQGIIPGASPLATAGSKAYLALLGQGGLGLGDLGPLGEIASTGLPSDINPLVTATKDVAFRNIDEQARATQAQFGPQGGRFSSDVYRGAGLVRERGVQDLNQTLAQLAYGASEQAAQRRLAGSGLLADVGGAARSSALQTLGLAFGQQIPDIQPGAISQALAATLPALTYGLASRGGGATAPAATPQGTGYKGAQPGKG